MNLTSLSREDATLTRKPDHQFHLLFDTYQIDNYEWHRKGLYGFHEVSKEHQHVTPQLNHISFSSPPVPLLSQRKELKVDAFCNESSLVGGDCITKQCSCTHVIQVKLDSVVEVIFISEGQYGTLSQHPFHLHGHFFRVVAYGKPNYGRNYTSLEEMKKLDEAGRIPRKLIGAPLKDTLRILTGWYAILRFYADNPTGYWFYHCHYEEHVEQGLGLIFKVGEHEDMLPVPKNFPRCGDYLPAI